MKLKTLLTILIIVLSLGSMHAQKIKKFSNEPDEFFKQLKILLAKGNNKKEGKAIVENLTTVWESGVFDERKQKKVVAIADALLKRRARAYPHFSDYFYTVMAFVSTNHDDKSVLQWEKGLINLCKKENQPYERFRNTWKCPDT